ncbi:ankyrin repeat-containing protein [Fusarium sp. NRRL 52700]|nr:ankyrin repeat-containing protein [Fusarium sp. NRRL 52700]
MARFRDYLRVDLGVRLDALHSILNSLQKLINWIENSARKIQPRCHDAEYRNTWKRFRVEVFDPMLKNCSFELDKQNSYMKSLVDILKLNGNILSWFEILFNVFEAGPRKSSYRFRHQALEAITDVKVKDKFQTSVTGLKLSSAWVICMIEELIPKSASREELSVALLKAATAGLLRNATALLKREARCTVRDESLMTPLHLAAGWGHYAMVKLLLSYKNKDWFAQGGITSIDLAARYGHSKVVKLLISNGGHAWKNDRADSPENFYKFKFPRVISHAKTLSARELAAIYGHESSVLAFPSTKKDDILHAMSSTCAIGNQSMVETIWRHHKQRSYFKRHLNPAKLVSTFHAPPLHLAVTSGNPALVAYLLERGFPVNDQGTTEGSEYSSPAHYAAMTGSAEILYLLKSSECLMTSLDFRERTPLSYAVEHEQVQAVSFLVRQASSDRSTPSKDVVTCHLGSGHREHMKGCQY